MNKNGVIVIVEDDLDDQGIFKSVFKDLNDKNKVLFFGDGQDTLEYLIKSDHKPFIVFSDINMPRLNRIKLRRKIIENKNIHLKTIPYLFFTTSADQQHVIDAYSKFIQGFFVKLTSFRELNETITTVIDYWQKCVFPNYTN